MSDEQHNLGLSSGSDRHYAAPTLLRLSVDGAEGKGPVVPIEFTFGAISVGPS